MPLVVAIDGPSGVGKSTAARGLAARLGVPMLDTGAMYRALGLRVLEAGVDPTDAAAVVAATESAVVDVRPDGAGGVEVLLDGEPVGERIRAPEVSEVTSRIAARPEVRRRLVTLQRDFGRRYGAVAEGRDVGTVVFPSTPHKFFLDADPRVRADRRHRELVAAGHAGSLLEVESDLARRDARDAGRETSPLVRDESYVFLDTSTLSPDAVIDAMESAIRRHEAAADRP